VRRGRWPAVATATPRRAGRPMAPRWLSCLTVRATVRSSSCCRSAEASLASSPRRSTAPVHRCGHRAATGWPSPHVSTSRREAVWLVVKETQPCESHGHLVLIAGGDDVRVVDGAAGLDDVLDAAGVGAIHVVAEGNVRV